MRRFASVLFVLLLCSIQIWPSEPSSDKAVFDNVIAYASAHQLNGKPTDIVLTAIGQYFLGAPYVEKSLDHDVVEKLTTNLTGFDCTTFVESSLALARCISGSKTSYSDFESELRQIRYRGGILDSYTSRLHYFSEWILDNCAKQILEDVTKECNGKLTVYKLNFMSTHPQYYPQLKSRPDYVDSIKAVEQKIGSCKFYELPKFDIEKNETKIHSGDIIAITTDIKGLDISHVGIAILGKNNRIYLLHASSSDRKVKISETPLAIYMSKHPHDTGIIVLRSQSKR